MDQLGEPNDSTRSHSVEVDLNKVVDGRLEHSS